MPGLRNLLEASVPDLKKLSELNESDVVVLEQNGLELLKTGAEASEQVSQPPTAVFAI